MGRLGFVLAALLVIFIYVGCATKQVKTPNLMSRPAFNPPSGTAVATSATPVETSPVAQPRRLNDAIRDDLQRMVRDNDIRKVYIQSVWGDPESKEFAAEIEEFFKSANLEVDGSPGRPARRERGIGIAIKGQAAYLTIGTNLNE